MPNLPEFGHNHEGSPDFIVTANNGFRAWELRYDKELPYPSRPEDHTFHSVVMNYEWQPGVNRAVCLSNYKRKHGLACAHPNKGCVCGFYAYYNLDAWGVTADHKVTYPKVHGVIEGYGRCVVGAKGFRAEKALIVGLLIPASSNISRSWLGDRDPDEGRAIITDILRAKFPLVPLYDRSTDLFRNSPLMGKPQVARDMEAS